MHIRIQLEEFVLQWAEVLLHCRCAPIDAGLTVPEMIDMIQGRPLPSPYPSVEYANLFQSNNRIGPGICRKPTDQQLLTIAGRVLYLAHKVSATNQTTLSFEEFEHVYDIGTSIHRLGGVL